MADLTNYMPGRVVATTNGEDGSEAMDAAVLVEVVERTEGEIELAFDMVNPKRRVYLKVREADLSAAMEQTGGPA